MGILPLIGDGVSLLYSAFRFGIGLRLVCLMGEVL